MVVQAELEESSGFKLERDAAQPGGFGGFGGLGNSQDPDSGVAKPLQNARRGSGATDMPQSAETRLDAILDDFAGKLAEEMADGMFKAAAEAVGEGSDEGRTTNDEIVENKGGNPYHCPKCGKFSGFNGHCDKCGYTLDADETQERAERLIGKAQSGTMLKPIDGIAYRKEVGQIDLEVGRRGVGKQQEHGTGLAKLRQKHGQDIHALAETLAHGEVMPITKDTKAGSPYDPDRKAIVHGDYVIFLARKGDRRWRISTHYKSAGEAAKAEEIKQWLRSGDRSHLQGDAV